MALIYPWILTRYIHLQSLYWFSLICNSILFNQEKKDFFFFFLRKEGRSKKKKPTTYGIEDVWVLVELFASLFHSAEFLNQDLKGLVNRYEDGERSWLHKTTTALRCVRVFSLLISCFGY